MKKYIKLIVSILGGVIGLGSIIINIISSNPDIFGPSTQVIHIITMITAISGVLASVIPELYDILKKAYDAIKKIIEAKEFDLLKEKMNELMVIAEKSNASGPDKLKSVLEAAKSYAKEKNLNFKEEQCKSYVNTMISSHNALKEAKTSKKKGIK